MEYENNFASKGMAGTALGFGIAGATLGAANSGLLNNLFGCNAKATSSDDASVTRYELNMQNMITNRDMEIAYLKGRDAAKTDNLELYRYIDGRFNAVERELADNRTYNAVNTATISCMQGQIAQLLSLTKVVIPNTSVCPGWGNVTVAPATTTTG